MKMMIKTAVWMMLIAAALGFGACDDGGGGGNDSGGTPITAPDAPGAARVTPADSQLSLEWDAVEDAVAYEVWYSETDDSGTATRHGGDITATNDVITGLHNGTTYYLWLRAKNSGGTSPFGDVASGTPEEAVAAPSAPGAAIVTPGDGQLDLAWSAVAGATGYEVWYSETDDSGTAAIAENGGNVSAARFLMEGLDNGDTYYIWLKAKNAVGTSPFGDVASGTPEEAVAAPSAPGAAIVTPGDGQLDLVWAAVDGATAYEVWYSETDDSGTAAIAANGGNVSATSFLVEGLDNGETYYIWLKAKNTAGTSGFGEVSSGMPEEAVVAPDAPAAATVTPADGQLDLAWAAVEGASWYEVWINDENVSATAYLAPDGGHVTGTSFTVDGLDNGTSYYVWIVACNPAGNSDFGEAASGMPDFDPAAVSGLAAVTAADQVTLTWTDPVSFALDHIEITWTPDAPFTVIVNPGTQSCDIGMPADGTARTFTVTCVFDDDTTFDATIETTGEAEIFTVADLDNVRNNLAAHYILMADINLGVAPYNSGQGWVPIGTHPSPFTGNFNGNGHIISNLYISRNAEYQGLIGVIGGEGYISGLTLSSINIVWALSDVGGLVGRNYGTIENCSTAGSVICVSQYGGGLVGVNGGTIDTSSSSCAVHACFPGGLAGWNNGTLIGCHATGAVSSDGVKVSAGGLVAINTGFVYFGYATGAVSSTHQGSYYETNTNEVGGLVGSNSGTIRNCFATGSVTGIDYNDAWTAWIVVGGLIGLNTGTAVNCYAIGSVAGTGDPSWVYCGGLIGMNNGYPDPNGVITGTVNASYYDTWTTHQTDTGKGIPRTTTQMKRIDTSVATYAGWDFTGETANGTADIWSIGSSVNSGYPYLTNNH